VLKMSREYLYQLSNQNRDAGAEVGAVMERLINAMAVASKGRLPKVYRTDLVTACRACEYAQKCLGSAAVRADFPVVTEGMVADSEGGEND